MYKKKNIWAIRDSKLLNVHLHLGYLEMLRISRLRLMTINLILTLLQGFLMQQLEGCFYMILKLAKVKIIQQVE